ncbi:MAG: replicative DNA helicase [Verrucomicrobiales bacterium]
MADFPNKNNAPELQKSEENKAERGLTPPPHALGPEKSILSSMLQDPAEYVGQAMEAKLTPAHFYVPAHGKLFEVLTEHFEEGLAIELIALTQHLMDRGIMDSLGGPAAITEIYTYAPTAAHFTSHLDIVKSKHTLRKIIHSCTEAITQAYDDPEDVREFLDTVEQAVLDIRNATETNEEENIKQTVKAVVQFFEEFLAGDRGISGLTTGYSVLDKMSNGLKPTEMFIIAARPSMGKTSFMMNIVEDIAINQQKPTMVFSCEMSSQQIVQRLLFSRARFAFSSLQQGYQPNKNDIKNITKAAKEISNSKLFIDDTAAISINDLRAKARRKKRDEDIQLIAIDYLQLMRSTSKQAANSREREIAEISSGLKALAKELNIPIIVLAQLNRGPESRTGSSLGVPRMSDLRESGSIEQDADMVGLLYRKAYYKQGTEENEEEDEEAEQGEAELVLAKNRNGPTGGIPLTFRAELMRFENSDRREEPQ